MLPVGENGGGDLFPPATGFRSQVLGDQAGDQVITILFPGSDGGRVLFLTDVDPCLFPEAFPAQTAVTVIVVGILPVLNDLVSRLEGFGQDHIREAYVVEMDAGQSLYFGQFPDGPGYKRPYLRMRRA